MRLQIGLLGPFRVWVDGEPVEVPSGRLQALLATLALSPGQPVSVERLVTAVWGADFSGDARVNLQSNVRRLRRLLGADVVTTRGRGYELKAESGGVDAVRFVRLLDEAAAAPDRRTQRETLADAVALWRGTPFEGVRSDWLEQTQAPRLQERYLAALEQRIDLDLADLAAGARTGTSQVELTAELGDLTGRFPLREPLWVRLLIALQLSGRPAEALQRYDAVRALLAEELGADPGPALQRAHADLLTGRAPQMTLVAAAARAVPRQLPAGTNVFTGRNAALRVLDGLLGSEDDQRRPMVIATITGTAGIGKTTLALQWAHRVADRFPDGQLYVNLRGFDPTGTPVESTDAVRGFLDALQVPPQQIPVGLDAQAGLFRSQLAGRRMLVVLDNARDADQVTALLPGTSGCLAIVTSRNQLSGLAAAGARPVALDLLDHGEAVQLLARRLGRDRVEAEPGATDDLVAWCAGLPLALAIVAARAASRPDFPLAVLADGVRESSNELDGLEGGDASTSARAVFSWSYRNLDDRAARLFRLLGLHAGPDMATAAAACLAGLTPAQAQPPLAELARAHLVTEHVPGRYTFHDLLRAYAAELARDQDPESERRAATHRLLDHYVHSANTADLLLYPYDEKPALNPIEPDVTVAAPVDREEALGWFEAEHQVLLAAVRHANRAGFHRHAVHLAWALSVFLQRSGRWHDRAAAHRAALGAARRLADTAAQSRAHRHLASAEADLGRFPFAHRHYHHALDLAEAMNDVAAQAETHYDRNLTYGLEGRLTDALAAAQQARRLFEITGDRIGQANALTDVGWGHARLGDHRQAVTLLQQALTLHQELGNLAYQAHTWSCLGDTYGQQSDLAQAIECHRRALDLFRDVGDRYGEASTLALLAALHRTAGDAEADDAWQRAHDLIETLDPGAADQLLHQLHQLRPTLLGPADETG